MPSTKGVQGNIGRLNFWLNKIILVLILSKFKTLLHKKFYLAQMVKIVIEKIDIIVGKGENTVYH